MINADLEALLTALQDVAVLAVGDVMLDRFVYGDVARVSAEAPIPVLSRRRQSAMLGGCGNVARNLTALGGQAILIGLVGEDDAARDLRALVAAETRMADSLIVDAARPTSLKTRFVSSGQQLLRVDHESTTPPEPALQAHLVAEIRRHAGRTRAILLSDYGKGVVTEAVIAACLAAARDHGLIVVVDSKAKGFDHYGEVDVVKPNASELARATDLPTDTDEQVEAALSRALETSRARAILVTRAAKGMSLAVRGEPVRHMSRPPPEVFDTSGAGDTALAALGLALASGAPIEAAMDLALRASSLVVQKAGTATVTPAEILAGDSVIPGSAGDSKITTPHRMAELAAAWREQGLRVGFTNGCFDILHAGHVGYLAQARSWCDRLIVALNTDESVRTAKGPGRPVNALASRARVMAALACVDLVTAFDDPTPLELINAARPDLLVKGGDYDLDGVVGRQEVLSWGGEVRLAPFLDGHSTTAILTRAAQGEGA